MFVRQSDDPVLARDRAQTLAEQIFMVVFGE
jgi:hypothetical protein